VYRKKETKMFFVISSIKFGYSGEIGIPFPE